MARLLFVIHGMGVHGPSWATPTIAHLNALPGRYGYSWFGANGSVDSNVTLVPISYDAVFSQYLDQWAESAQALEQFGAQHGVGMTKVITWLNAASPAEQTFFWTSCADVLLYRLFQIVTAEVRLKVRLAMAQAITTASQGGTIVSASVLAHSLGTCVAHDSLALLATQPIDTPNGPNSSFMLGNWRFEHLFMAANVSRILETRPKVYESPIHPFTVQPQQSYTRRYYNFRHVDDPVPAFRPFAPVGWGSAYVSVENCVHVQAFNVHDLDHYLEDPRVHVPLLRGLIDDAVVTPAEFTAAMATYDATPEPNCVAVVKKFRTDARQLVAQYSGTTDPEHIVIATTKALALAKEATDAC